MSNQKSGQHTKQVKVDEFPNLYKNKLTHWLNWFRSTIHTAFGFYFSIKGCIDYFVNVSSKINLSIFVLLKSNYIITSFFLYKTSFCIKASHFFSNTLLSLVIDCITVEESIALKLSSSFACRSTKLGSSSHDSTFSRELNMSCHRAGFIYLKHKTQLRQLNLQETSILLTETFILNHEILLKQKVVLIYSINQIETIKPL